MIAAFCACNKPQTMLPIKIDSDFEKADSLYNKGNDSAFYYYNKVATVSSDSLLVARAYNGMAIIQSEAGDHFGSQQSLLLSLGFLNESKEGNINCLASDYNELGNTSLHLKNFDGAIYYFGKALQYIKNKDYRLTILNNQAVCYKEKKQYPEAIGIYTTIIKGSSGNQKQYARILSNFARTKWLQDSTYNAAPELLTALHLRESEKDEWGLNASYAHLCDYYTISQPTLALEYANKRYAMAQQIGSPDDELEALQKLIVLGPVNTTRQYFVRYQYLNDSLQTSRSAAKNQFALIRFDAGKNREDNLRLQKENTEQENQIILLVLAVSFFIALAAIIVILNRKRKQRIQLEAQNNIRDSRLKTSKKVHDVVANGLYQIMTRVQYDNHLDREALLDEIDTLYEKSRDISYDRPVSDHAEFSAAINQLLTSFSTVTTNVLLVGNDEKLWDHTSERVKHELKYVLQELMVNMHKHSSASNVVIKFEKNDQLLHIQYTDDGIGLQPGVVSGNGLTNTGNRINDIHGKFTFDTHVSKGLKIHIHIPIS